MGLSMIEVIQDVQSKATDQETANLNMRIGIHTVIVRK